MFDDAKWIWNSDAKDSDCYMEFLVSKSFGAGDSTVLRLSADSNYAVYINGIYVDSGQYADYSDYKVYDELNISSSVVPGINYIAIIVWYYGIDSFTYCKGNPGLIFELEQNGRVVLSSDERIQSRISRRYINGKNELITSQLGLNFHIDMRESNEWMLGRDAKGFANSCIQERMPTQLFPREVQKPLVKEPVPTTVVQQGSFLYQEERGNAGEQMQHALLGFSRLSEMACQKDGIITQERKSGDGVYFIMDLGSVYAGYLEFDMEVAEDCYMEVGWGEHLADGRCRTSIAGRNFSATVHLKAGRNCYMNPFRRLGCRYIQFFLHTTRSTIYYAGLRPVEYPVKMKQYKTGNLLRDTIYAVCQNTLLHCMHEHYEDCPWREQALYNMDSRNQMLCGYYAFEEYEFPRSNLRLMAKAIREDDMLPICFPTDNTMCIPSFTLAYPMQLAEYYRYTKDKETIVDCFDTVKRIMDGFIRRIDTTGLIPNFDRDKNFWNFYEWSPYMDGVSYQEDSYDMCLNAMFSYMLDFFLELCDIVGTDKASYQQEKAKLNRKIAEEFYDNNKKLFRLCKGPMIEQFSVLANAYGYLCGAADDLDSQRILQMIKDNESKDEPVIPVTLSMNAFRYDALLKANREYYKNYILEEIDHKYFRMLREGATTFWETEVGASDFGDAGSLCHGWSALPIYYYEILD